MATTIADELTRIKTAKAEIRTAIERKGGEVDGTATIDKYPEYIASIPTDIELESVTITTNGTTTPEAGTAYNEVTVNVQPTLQAKTITRNGTYTPDTGYDGLSSVNVNVAGASVNKVTMYKEINAYYQYSPYKDNRLWRPDYWDYAQQYETDIANLLHVYVNGTEVSKSTNEYNGFNQIGVYKVEFVFADNYTIQSPLWNDMDIYLDMSEYQGGAYRHQIPNKDVYIFPQLSDYNNNIRRNWLRVYLPDSITTISAFDSTIHLTPSVTNPNFKWDGKYNVLNKSTDSIVAYTYGDHSFPDNTTTATAYSYGYVFGSGLQTLTLKNYTKYLYFKSTTPPQFILDGSVFESPFMIVPKSAVNDYKTALLTAGVDQTYVDDVRPLNYYEVTVTYSGERMCFATVGERRDMYGWFEVYDWNGNLVHTVKKEAVNEWGMYYGEDDVFTAGRGNYKVKCYLFNDDNYYDRYMNVGYTMPATEIDFSGMTEFEELSDLGMEMYTNQLTVIVPDNVTKLYKRVMNQGSMDFALTRTSTLILKYQGVVALDNLNDKFNNCSHVQVQVYDPAAYRADSNWAWLESEDRIDLVNYV